MSPVAPAQRTARCHRARGQLRWSQLELAVLQQKPDELLRLAAVVDREIGEWSAAIRAGRAVAIDRAYAQHYCGLNRYFSDRRATAVDGQFAKLTQFRAAWDDPHYAR